LINDENREIKSLKAALFDLFSNIQCLNENEFRVISQLGGTI